MVRIILIDSEDRDDRYLIAGLSYLLCRYLFSSAVSFDLRRSAGMNTALF